ncbi:hypothetical protein D9756_005972 [Leucocoprinus leucothites]|uniref:Pentatricopeptide repeat-containing protein n=1 Tax=Leucocoprinus leucothites TaxID=201217 RepID=A0A8H5D5K5_9AGAR|nr:hypothetical protein D9756_005972 [Leucoagaricus leucothites]
MSICRTLLRAGSRSFPRPSSTRRPSVTPYPHFSRQLFILNDTSANDADTATSSTTSIEQHVEGLTKTNDIRNIHSHYTTLVAKLKESKERNHLPTREILTEAQIHKILWLLARSGRPSDVQRIYDILLDMPLVLGVKPTLETHTAIIRGLIRRGDSNATRRWLEGMPMRAGNFTPSIEQYHLFLEALPDMEGASLKLMRSVVNKMRQSGCKPTTETFKLVFLGRMKLGDLNESPLRPVSMAAVFEDMEREDLPYDPSFGELLLQEFTKRGQTKVGQQILGMYEDKFRDEDREGRKKLSPTELKLVQMAQAKGMHSAIHYFKHLRPKQNPSEGDITAMLRHSLQSRDLQLLEREFGVKCTIIHWSLLINNNVRAGKPGVAYSILKTAKDAGIVPDAPMITPLIRFLCQSRPSPSEEEQHISLALYLYDELRKACPPPESVPSEPNEHSKGPDYTLYTTLLRGLSTSKQSHKYMEIAKELMGDMVKRNLVPDDSNMFTSIIILYMRNAPTVEDALAFYRQHKSALDESGFTAVLAAFCKLRFGDSIQIPSLKGYFEIVKDMRLAGFDITVEVYTILLNQLGFIATQILKEGGESTTETRNSLVSTTRRVHDLLSLDASLSPDTILWNQLMDTYQRLGCFGDAYRVWEMIYLSGQFDSTSVSVMLDACAFSEAYSVARKIITKLTRDDYQFTSHNWNTWMECLCRMGRLDEAIGFLCGKEESLRNVKRDVESVKIVFKFAKSQKREAEVLVHVRAMLPHIWEQLPSSIRELI